jgi:CRP-like cAMP-binding protein
MDLNTLIDQNPILSLFDSGERRVLNGAVTRKEYKRGAFIAHYGEPWPFIFLVEAGLIDVLKYSPDGRNLGALAMTHGELFWSPSFFDEGPLPATLEVKEDCRIYLWDKKTMHPLIQGNHKAHWAWTLMLVERIRMASDFLEELAFHPLAGRLARLLLEQFDEHEVAQVAREFTLDEMSAKINTSPVMVCKLLSRFAADGLIKVSRTTFELIDRSELVKVCGPRS